MATKLTFLDFTLDIAIRKPYNHTSAHRSRDRQKSCPTSSGVYLSQLLLGVSPHSGCVVCLVWVGEVGLLSFLS